MPPLPKSIAPASDRELDRLTSAEAMAALAPEAARAYRQDATDLRDLLDARPDPEEA
jgi:hypothetical protein